LDFGALPLLLMTLLMDPVPFAYLPWPEAEPLFYYPGYRFLGEIGQFLAWTNEVWHGGWQGRDFFCLYGPVYIFSILGMWKAVGKSVQSLYAYWQIMAVFSGIVAYAFFRQFSKWRVLCFLAALILIFSSVLEYQASSCRFTAAIGAITLLAAHGRGIRGLVMPAGILTALALATSQEVGLSILFGALVFMVCRSFALGFLRLTANLLTFSCGMLVVLVPIAALFAWNGALRPMVSDIIGYPRFVSLGYGNYFFPRADAIIPLNVTGAPLSSLFIQTGFASTMLFYYGPAMYAACGAYISVRMVLSRWKLDVFDSMIAGLTAAGVILFGAALGRSDYAHLIFALPPAIVLHILFLGRSARIVKERVFQDRRGRGRGEILLCALFILVSALFFNPSLIGRKLAMLTQNNSIDRMLLALRPPKPLLNMPTLSFVDVATYVKKRFDPSDYILALPSNSAYYYLADRRNATRFCQFSMLATDEHRAEVLRDITRRKPKYVIYDITGERVDDLSDEVQFPGPLWFILKNYSTEKRMGNTLILLKGECIRGWLAREDVVFDWDMSGPEHASLMGLRGVTILNHSDSGLRIRLETGQSELSIDGLKLDSDEFYELVVSANIQAGNRASISWTVNTGGARETYSKLFAVDLRGRWEQYRIFIASPQPYGSIEFMKLALSDEPTDAVIREIKLIHLKHLSLREQTDRASVLSD